MKFEKKFILNYPGNVEDIIDGGWLFGPNTMGEVFRAVFAAYDDQLDRTTVQFEVVGAF